MKKIAVADLKPGMVTPDWEVLSEPRASHNGPGNGFVVDMKHRVDRGESTIWYDADEVLDVVEVPADEPTMDEATTIAYITENLYLGGMGGGKAGSRKMAETLVRQLTKRGVLKVKE